MVLSPDQGDVKAARDFAARSGFGRWLPFYPLCAAHCITETYVMAFQCYREMAALYGAKQLHSNALGRPLEMPRQVMACSPGSLSSSQGERKRMRQLNHRDMLVDIALVKSEREIMTKGQAVPEYMRSGTQGDFTGLPPLHFYYGGVELLCALAESCADACEVADVPCTMTVAPGMSTATPWFPGSRKGRLPIWKLWSGFDGMEPFVFRVRDCYYIRADYLSPGRAPALCRPSGIRPGAALHRSRG